VLRCRALAFPSAAIAILLFVVGALGGALNSVAGGGSFLAFPTILFAGVPPVAANATTAVALWPAGLTSLAAYRNHLAEQEKRTLTVLAIASALGGGVGAKLLLVTSDETFAKLVPFLLLAASLVFTFGPRLSRGKKRHVPLAVGAFVQLIIASYGGYFGGGMGILMLATMTLMGMDHIHRMNALKVVLGLLINGVALVFFLLSGKVDLGVALPTTLGALLGGWLGADIARRIDPKKVRVGVLVFAWCLTIFFFLRRHA
jgi:uncharacterized membrane protein YfcA